MEKLKELVKEQTEIGDEPLSDSQLGELKEEINMLLHLFLPGHITIREAECLSCAIYDCIVYPENYLP